MFMKTLVYHDTTNCVSEAGDIVGNVICLLLNRMMDLDFPRNFGIVGALSC